MNSPRSFLDWLSPGFRDSQDGELIGNVEKFTFICKLRSLLLFLILSDSCLLATNAGESPILNIRHSYYV